jgi:hypothetical protein
VVTVLKFPGRCETSERIELGRLGKAFQLVRSERHDERRIEQLRKPLRHQKRLAGATVDSLQSGYRGLLMSIFRNAQFKASTLKALHRDRRQTRTEGNNCYPHMVIKNRQSARW